MLRLPFTKDTATKSGLQYTRFRLKAEMTLLKSATLVLDSPRIVAQLATGRSSGRGLFRRPETRLFQAVGSGRELVIQPLPLKGRPESFAGAVGSSFSLEVRADRTVVEVGEPVQLELMVRGQGELAGLQLPTLDQAGLDPDLFVMPATAPIGEDIEEGKNLW